MGEPDDRAGLRTSTTGGIGDRTWRGQAMNPEPDWRDALVELHILTEHGDPDAATRAARWLARDPAARHAWDEVQHTCDTVRRRTAHESAARR